MKNETSPTLVCFKSQISETLNLAEVICPVPNPNHFEIHESNSTTDKTTRCVIRSLRGRGLWLGGKRNYSINKFANQSVEFIC